MELKNVNAKFNEYYYSSIAKFIEDAKDNDHYARWLNQCIDADVDFSNVIYKKLIDDEQEVCINSKHYLLLPMGLINSNIPMVYVNDENIKPTNNSVSVKINGLNRMFLAPPKFKVFYYPEYLHRPNKENSSRCCDAYIKHYRDTLGEIWSERDFYTMLSQLKYLTAKYARDEDTGEIFIVGFFGAFVRNGAGGECLTNAELFVMPEFRNLGIAKKMVGVSFYQAKQDGIDNFDSITYRVQSTDALAFWESVGASVSGLVHIEGSIPEMLDKIDKSTIAKKEGQKKL